jgi:hypothetical protein
MKFFQPLYPIVFIAASCTSIRDLPKYQLANDEYEFRQSGTTYKKVLIEMESDTIHIYDLKGSPLQSIFPSRDEYFRQRSFDVDVMSIGFRYRPAISDVPNQLTTQFNGNLFLGYRIDRFMIDFRSTPIGLKKKLTHRAVTAGVFGGFGATPLNPTTTSGRIAIEYDGLIVARGFALMVGINQLTVGAGLGWDFLTGANKSVWIYQNKPWLGLTVGLNLN